MAADVRRKKRSHFYRNLIIIDLVVLVAIGCGLKYFWDWLADYQSAQPSNLCDTVRQAYADLDADYISSHCSDIPAQISDGTAFKAYLQKAVDTGDIEYYPVKQDDKSQVKYVFQSKGNTIANLTLNATGEKTKHGFALYEVGSIELFPLGSYTLTVQDGCTALVGGAAVDASALQSAESLSSTYTEIGHAEYKKNVYKIDDYGAAVTATAPEGMSCSVSTDPDTGAVTVTLLPSDEITSQLSEAALNAAKKYIVFATKADFSSAAVASLVYPNTALLKSIRNYSNYWGQEYTTDAYNNVATDSFTAYSKNDYSCRVSLTYVINVGSSREKSYPFNSYMYFTNANGKWQWVAMQPA